MSFNIKNGVAFSDSLSDWSKEIHSYNTLGLYFADKQIGSPEPYTFQVEVPGRDGLLDVSDDFFKVPTYKNRTLTVHLMTLDAVDNWSGIYSDIANRLHGKKKYIRFDEDKGYAYHGRVTINNFETSRHKGLITLSMDCEPYKLETDTHETTTIIDGVEMNGWLWDPFDFHYGYIQDNIVNVSGSATIPIHNEGRRYKFSFKSTATMQVSYNGSTMQVPAGEWKDSDFYIVTGDSSITVTGTGKLYMKWSGGLL